MKALVLLGGSGVSREMLLGELALADLVVAADSGAEQLDAIGRLPDSIVGDMDSIDAGLLERLESYGVEIFRAEAAKDETDGWLAVDRAIASGAAEMVLLGALGGRLDHLLGNQMLLVRAAKQGVRAVMRAEGCEAFATTGAVEIRGAFGQTVSILPVGCGVSVCYLDGLQYGTQDPLKLPVDAPVGVSNVMTADVAHIAIDGWAYVIKFDQVQHAL